MEIPGTCQDCRQAPAVTYWQSIRGAFLCAYCCARRLSALREGQGE
jgi:hypothetical protein